MKTTVTVEIEVPQEWIYLCTGSNDLFRRDHSGYWAHGCERNSELGWLVYVHPEEAGAPPESSEEAAAGKLWRGHGRLPPGFYQLDTNAAIRAFEEGCKRFGVGWFQDGKTDATTYDVVVQLALLGEVVYG